MQIEKAIRDNKVRGLVVGYPLEENKPVIIIFIKTPHAFFIENFIKHLTREEILDIPVTFVNEQLSTFQAGKFLELYEGSVGNNNKSLSRNKLVS